MNELIDTTRLKQGAEFINNAIDLAERGVAMAVTGAIQAGTELLEMKEIVPHGEWSAWIGKNLACSQAKANRYMRIASNSSCVTNLKDAESVNEALRMIADSKPETAPRSERKSGQVEVVEPSEKDPDPPPKPPTNRKTSAGSQKIAEDDKPQTQTVPAEIIIDDPADADVWELMTFGEILGVAVSKLADDQKKKAAKELRKAADKLDPPTKFVKPDLEDVSAYFAELKAVDPDSFFDFYESKGWLVGKVSMKDWRASARKWVRENQANGKGNSNGSAHRGTGRRGLTAEEVFSAESLGRGR